MLWITIHRCSLGKAQIFCRNRVRAALSRAALGASREFLPFRHTGNFRAGLIYLRSLRLWKIRAALIAQTVARSRNIRKRDGEIVRGTGKGNTKRLGLFSVLRWF